MKTRQLVSHVLVVGIFMTGLCAASNPTVSILAAKSTDVLTQSTTKLPPTAKNTATTRAPNNVTFKPTVVAKTTGAPAKNGTAALNAANIQTKDQVNSAATKATKTATKPPGVPRSTKARVNNPTITTKAGNHKDVGKSPLTNGTSGHSSSNASTSSNQQSIPGNVLQSLAAINGLLGNILPKKAVDLVSVMAQNQSAWTLQNMAAVLLPVGRMIGVQALTQDGVSGACSKDIGLIIDGVLARKTWALKMLDATFKIPANLYDNVMTGSPKSYGDYDECMAIHEVTNDVNKHEISGKYCHASFALPLPPAVKQVAMMFDPRAGSGHVGLCVSAGCSASDLTLIISNLEKQLLNGTVPYPASVNCVEDMPWKADMIVVTCFLAILGAMVIIGTLYDAFAVHLRATSQPHHVKKAHTNGYGPAATHTPTQNGVSNGGYVADYSGDKDASVEMTETNVDSVVHNGNISDAVEISQEPPKRELGTAEQICLSFSVYSNAVKLLGTGQGSGSLGAVNGIRFLSMGWVILGHTYYFAIHYDSNMMPSFFGKLNEWSFYAIPYAGVSVDSFFTLSGVLVAYLTLRELKKVGGASKMNWFMFYFHRFWRLTPPYMLVMMVGTVVLPYVVRGPMVSQEEDLPLMGECRTHWWTNLLYINNYVGVPEHMCMGWGWYLANDMQFYIISPLILLPFFYNAIAGAIVSGAFLLATIAAVGVVDYKHGYPAQLMSMNVDPPKDANYYRNLYAPSYARLGPYLVGLITGYLLYRCKCKCRIPRVANVAGWLFCLGTTCAVIYGMYTDGDSHVMSKWESVVFVAVFRTVWGVALCWVIFACATGHGGWINDALSWRAYVPLGRLTYCAYLVHPLVQLVYYMSRRNPVYVNNYEIIYLFLAHMVMAYGVAFVTSLFFESPMMGLEKAVFKKSKK